MNPITKYDIPVVILCGGYGTRMKEETEFIPKPLVPIGSIPMIVHIMNIYYRYGYKKFVLPIGYKGDMIKDYFVNYRFSGDFRLKVREGKDNIVEYMNAGQIKEFDITFIDTGLETQTGARLKMVGEYLKNDSDTFMLTYGDGVADINIQDLVDFHFEHGKVATVTGVSEPFRYGMITEEANRVIDFGEKTGRETTLINGGFFVMNTKFLDYIDDSLNTKLETTPLSSVAADDQLMVYLHDGRWACADMLREVDELNEMYYKGEAFWIH